MNTIETGPSDNARDSEMWSRSWTQFRVDRRSAEQVIVAANAYGSSKQSPARRLAEGKVRYVRASFDVVVVGVFAGAPQSCSIC